MRRKGREGGRGGGEGKGGDEGIVDTYTHASQVHKHEFFLFFFVIIVTACGRYIVDRFNRYRGNKTTEGSEKEKYKHMSGILEGRRDAR